MTSPPKRGDLRRLVRALFASLGLLACAAGAAALLAYYSRNYTRLGHRYRSVGEPIKGDIDIDHPVPFLRLDLGRLVVGLSCSGGGSRAAYFAAAVLSEIHRLSLSAGPAPRPRSDLLAQFDAVSSVSGGSLAAAFFVANGARLEEAAADSDEWTRFLANMAASYRRREWFHNAAISPATWFKLAFTNYNRGLMARDDYDESLFHGETIGGLPPRPALFINAFDVGNHTRFVFSRHYIDTTLYQPPDWWGRLRPPRDITDENDLGFCRVDPDSVRVADAVYASSAFPVAYPNLSLNHYGSKILFQGRRLFLADGGLVDNSGLVTLLTQLKAHMDGEATGRLVLMVYIDASIDDINTEGTKFQQQGVEDDYAWHGTSVAQGIQTIDSANAMVQDLTWKLAGELGVVTDQLSMNWPRELRAKAPAGTRSSKASWDPLVASGRLALRPCIIRVGLRDLSDPDYLGFYSGLEKSPDGRLQRLLRAAGFSQLGPYVPVPGLPERLQRIRTDFALNDADRRALDLAAYLLVNGKLASDIQLWNKLAGEGAGGEPAGR